MGCPVHDDPYLDGARDEGLEDDIVNEELQSHSNDYDEDYDVFGHDAMGLDEEAAAPSRAAAREAPTDLTQLYPRFP